MKKESVLKNKLYIFSRSIFTEIGVRKKCRPFSSLSKQTPITSEAPDENQFFESAISFCNWHCLSEFLMVLAIRHKIGWFQCLLFFFCGIIPAFFCGISARITFFFLKKIAVINLNSQQKFYDNGASGVFSRCTAVLPAELPAILEK